ncbi:hypothetical protein [Saccharothrix syringae]|uniref:Uncharacterized protein n=1 Tax=Saccharothrix syringae TaxID=103733 RepID=A0A5Q0H2L9_SACSY|nr:hypothetical protein [Saccharothrix syringae]QFZ20379.1 hypothetical protein EKG83_25805 [Saccharothrix syringae]
MAAARVATDPDAPELWVPDDTDPDASFRALLAAVSRAPSGSGRLIWQPFEDDDTIRTNMLMRATPYPHFPVRQDESWIDAAVAKAALLAIPLRYVVSYRPDPYLRSHVEPETPFPVIPLPPQDAE